MSNIQIGEYPVITIPKTCSRCGSGFRTEGKAHLCPSCRAPKPKPRRTSWKLTSRQRQIVGLIKQAKTNREIAAELLISEGTVKVYVSRIFEKLHVGNRTEIAIRNMDDQDQ